MKDRLRRALCMLAGLGGLATLGLAHADALEPGQAVTVEVPPDSINTDFFVDVPPGITAMEVSFASESDALDIDLMARFAEPFGADVDSFQAAQEQADYWSVSSTAEERFRINTTGTPPLQQGRWHFALLSFQGAQSVEATLEVELIQGPIRRAQIELVFDDPSRDCGTAGWNAERSFAGQGGNNAETLGEARKAAMRRAVDELESKLTSPVKLTLQACWNDLGTGQRVTLAQATPRGFLPNAPGTSFDDTWYAGTAAARLGGTDLCRVAGGPCGDPDMQAQFNLKVDTNEALGSTDWYYGFDRSARPQGSIDFISVATHELVHGLGFVSLVSVGSDDSMNGSGSEVPPPGTRFRGMDDIFSERLVFNPDDGTPTPFLELTREQRVEAMTSEDALQWATDQAMRSPRNLFRTDGEGYPWLHAPPELQPGSSVSHLHRSFFNELMRPDVATQAVRDMGLAAPMLDALGWDDEPKAGVQRGIWFDRAHNGHGFDIQRAGDRWFILFYTYDADGRPVWYGATGTVADGVFTTDDNGLVRFIYDDASETMQATADPAFDGGLTVDFAATREGPACGDGVDRSGAAFLAGVEWRIGERSGTWCIEPFRFADGRPEPNFTGSWFDPTEPGWGLTFYQQGDGNPAAAVLYYFDANGDPRWALGTTQAFRDEQSVTMDEFRGYCPGCESAAAEPLMSSAGTVSLEFVDPAGGEGNRASIDVVYQGDAGGTWRRDDVPVRLLSDRAP